MGRGLAYLLTQRSSIVTNSCGRRILEWHQYSNDRPRTVLWYYGAEDVSLKQGLNFRVLRIFQQFKIIKNIEKILISITA